MPQHPLTGAGRFPPRRRRTPPGHVAGLALGLFAIASFIALTAALLAGY